MWGEIGHFALILAFVLAIVQSVVPFIGAARADPALMAFGRATAIWQALFVAIAFGCLIELFVGLEFSYAIVAQHTHSTQPLIYRFAGTWGNHEGSLLLWVLILAVFGGAVAWFGDNLRETLQARVLAVQGLIGVAFMALLLFTSNPFERLVPAALDGSELNPLLQDPGLALHPPLLYLGYVGFSVAFAFAVAALIEGRVDAAWARWVRPWVLAAWVSLTAGIALGSFWAYYELGWGGWWFWDPVENASLMPWLLGTALLHSALVLERRGALISWTILLGILTFSLSLVGTFLVRSGILTSVHAFAVDAERGVFILAMIIGFTGAALALFAWRAPTMKSGAMFGAVSREGGLTANNLFLMAATATVFLGTFYPVVVDAVNGDKISVGPPFYAITFVPIVIPLLLLVTPGPMLQWKKDRLPALWQRLRWPAIAALALFAITVAFSGLADTLAAFGLGLGLWLVLGALLLLVRRARLGAAAGDSSLRLLRTTPLAVYGMVMAHAGLGLMTAGMSAMTAWETSKVVTMTPGATETLGDIQVTLSDVRMTQGPNYQAEQALFLVRRGSHIFELSSERRAYPVSGQQTTEAGIHAEIRGNTYVAIGEASADGLVVRIYNHPLVGWIWAGAILMSLGGCVSLGDRRLRVGAPSRAARTVTPPPVMAPAE
ncbi:heme lyase CcmF/NrfE family subunit [Sphingoaurantiacus capsulatus]|uniref:Heme lyase CcmF/NrfE family subunit n=1 Tax=Sphingoaurantiacus capsulatus TaxID=1771310 RepID=A0ABV7X8Y9_9SPHN